MSKKKILDIVNDYYTEKIQKHDATSQGIDWNSIESHHLRFKQLCKVLPKEKASVLDFGCGFGSLLGYFQKKNSNYKYEGFDISAEMIQKAKTEYPQFKDSFTTELNPDKKYDFVIANGIFNVRLNTSDKDWQEYILETLEKINKIATKGFAFNILTSYSDKEFMRDYLFYANPNFYFDYCKKHFAKNVALLHDYDLYEFTILIKK